MTTSTEDFIASDGIEENEQKVSADLNCPLCQDVFDSPRRLPCLHAFCQDCLQSHISNTATINGSAKEFSCPICGHKSRANDEIALDKWVLLFPLNTLLLSVLLNSKMKVHLECNVCQAEDISSRAEDLCIICEEALCKNCSKVHRGPRLSTTHTILKIKELITKQDAVLQNHAVFYCTEHAQSPVEFYCTVHETLLCIRCLFARHKNCARVVELGNETPDISDSLMQMKEQMQKLENQVQMFAKINLSNLSKLETEVDDLSAEIRRLKETINTALNDLERRVKEEGHKLFQEEKERIERLNHGCQSHATAIWNSNVIVESASRYATQSQIFMLTKTIMNQLLLSQRQIEDKYSKNDILTFQLEVNSQIESITTIPRGNLGRLKVKRNDESPIICHAFKLLKECKAEPVHVKNVNVPDKTKPWFTSATFTSDMQVLLVNKNNKTCYLLDSSYEIATSYSLSQHVWNVCMIDETKAAITLPREKSVNILSIENDSITPIRQICTKYKCYGIAAYTKEELIVSGPCCEGKKYYWSLITLEGKEKSYHDFDCDGYNQTYVALNALKTRLYISVYDDSSLHCFGLDGKKYFTFKHQDLRGVQGVAVDRDDNVYVAGADSYNIFQLSPDGSLSQVIVKDLKKSPNAMCFNQKGNKFLLTHFKDTSLSIFAMKDNDG